MKKTVIRPIAVALSVCWYIQIVRPKFAMAEVSTEINCPSQITIKAVMPVGLWVGVCITRPVR